VVGDAVGNTSEAIAILNDGTIGMNDGTIAIRNNAKVRNNQRYTV
jgi:hypothetical protein